MRCQGAGLPPEGREEPLRVGWACPGLRISRDDLGDPAENKERPWRRSCRFLGERQERWEGSGGTLRSWESGAPDTAAETEGPGVRWDRWSIPSPGKLA